MLLKRIGNCHTCSDVRAPQSNLTAPGALRKEAIGSLSLKAVAKSLSSARIAPSRITSRKNNARPYFTIGSTGMYSTQGSF